MKKSKKKPVGIIVYGACGRMGRTISKLASSSPYFYISALIEKKDHPLIGNSMLIPDGGSYDEHELLDHIPLDVNRTDVVMDFSTRDAFKLLMKQITKRRLRIVSGTTGFSDAEIASLKRYAERTPVFYDTNMSFGITVLKHLLRETKSVLGSSFDTEIVEYHHRHKRDFPSGTALSLAREIASKEDIVIGRGRKSTRDQGKIHIHSVRSGGITGEHRIVCSSDEEVITLSHTALSRDVFARGALLAAEFISSKAKGLFSMKYLLDKKYG